MKKFTAVVTAVFTLGLFSFFSCDMSVDDEGNRKTYVEQEEENSTVDDFMNPAEWNDEVAVALTSEAWWSGESSDITTLTAGDYVTYTFKVKTDADDCMVEAYDSASTIYYLSTTSQKTAWTAGQTAALTNAGSQELGVLKAGNIYTATVYYDGTSVTITYCDWGTDGSSATQLFTTSTTGTVTAPVSSHFVAQYGTFYVITETGSKNKTLSSISVDSDSAQTTYSTNAKFSAENLVVTATYTSGATAKVTENLTYSYVLDEQTVSLTSGETAFTTAGNYTITVTYTEGDVTQTATYEVTVTDAVVLNSISVDTTSATTAYTKGSPFSSDSVTVTATYSDNSTKTVTGAFSGYDMSTAGSQTVTVSYTEDGVTKTAEYTIVVQEALGYTVSGTIAKDTKVPPLAVTSSTGVSVSFALSNYTSDWADTFRAINPSDTTEGVRQHADCLGWFNSSSWCNWWPALASGTAATFTNTATARFVTISYNTDGTIAVYNDGELMVSYGADLVSSDNSGPTTISNANAVVLSAFAAGNVTMLDSNDNAIEAVMTNLYIAAAVDASGAETLYKEKGAPTAATLAVSGETVTYQQGDTFSFGGTATLTDSYGRTYTVTPAVTGGDTSSTGPVTVTVTYTAGDSDLFTGSASTTYEITVTKAISNIAETTASGLSSDTIYYNLGALKSALVDSSLVITATYSDDSSEAIDLSMVTFTYAENKLTAAYAGKTLELSETFTCASNEGSYSSANAGTAVALESGKTIVATFTQDTKGSSNWNTCYPVISNVTVNSTVNTLYCRTDNWVNDIGNADIDGVYTIASDWDWDAYATFMVAATGTVTIAYNDSTISVNMSFANGETTHYQNYTFVNTGTENPSVVLFADGCSATFE